MKDTKETGFNSLKALKNILKPVRFMQWVVAFQISKKYLIYNETS